MDDMFDELLQGHLAVGPNGAAGPVGPNGPALSSLPVPAVSSVGAAGPAGAKGPFGPAGHIIGWLALLAVFLVGVAAIWRLRAAARPKPALAGPALTGPAALTVGPVGPVGPAKAAGPAGPVKATSDQDVLMEMYGAQGFTADEAAFFASARLQASEPVAKSVTPVEDVIVITGAVPITGWADGDEPVDRLSENDPRIQQLLAQRDEMSKALERRPA